MDEKGKDNRGCARCVYKNNRITDWPCNECNHAEHPCFTPRCEDCKHDKTMLFEGPCFRCLMFHGKPCFEEKGEETEEKKPAEGKAEKSPTRTVRVVFRKQDADGNSTVDVECERWDIRSVTEDETFEAMSGGRIVFRASFSDILYIKEVER